MDNEIFNIKDIYFSYYGYYKEENGKRSFNRLNYGLPYIIVNKVMENKEVRFKNTLSNENTLYKQIDEHKESIDNNTIIIGSLGNIYPLLTGEEVKTGKISKERIRELYCIVNKVNIKNNQNSNVIPFRPRL